MKTRWSILSLLLLSGCATPGVSKLEVEPPKPHTVENERVINENFDVLWNRLTKGLARSFYVINNIDKESRIINVSFNSDTPEQFIDCGHSTRTYQRENQQPVTYRYPVAESSQYKLAGTWQRGLYTFPKTIHASRKTSLEGRTNVYVAPRNDAQTEISVNTRYVLLMSTSGTVEAENAYGMVVQRAPIPTQTNQHSFNTNQPNTYSDPTGQHLTRCYATGKLETAILDLAVAGKP